MRKYIPETIVLVFMLVYCLIQVHIINHTNGNDEIISARAQDVLIFLVTVYFKIKLDKK